MNILSKLLFGDNSGLLSKEQFLFFLLVISAVMGPGISFGPFYLFYLIMAIYVGFRLIFEKKLFLSSIVDVFRLKQNYFFIFTILYFLIWLPFAESQFYAAKHLFFISVGYCFSILIISRTNSLKDIEFLIRCLAFIFLFDLLIGTLEATQLFRWPISKLSEINHWFGRENQLHEVLESNSSRAYVFSMPTGFHWNPNHFSSVLTLGFPFFLFHKKYWVSSLGMLLTVVLIVSAGAKLSFLAAIGVVLFSLLFFRSYWKQIITLMVILAFFISGGFHIPAFKASKKMVEVKSLFYSSADDEPVESNDSSVGYRMALIKEGLEIYKENPFFGVGGGNSQSILKEKGGIGKYKITNFHNYWLEIPVEGGAFYYLVFLVWVFSHLMRIIKYLIQKQTNNKARYFTVSLLTAGVGFFFSSIGASSIYGFLPFYILIGLLTSISLSLYKSKSY